MRKILIAVSSLIMVACLFPGGDTRPGDEIAMGVVAPRAGSGSDVRLADNGDSGPSSPSQFLAADRLALSPFDRFVRPSTDEELLATNPEQSAAALLELANYNRAQLYNVILHALESGGLDGDGFRDFILATLGEMGNEVPGTVMAALVQNAPSPALRLSALQLLNQANQELMLDGVNRALQDQDPAIRESALALLDEMGMAALLDALTEAVFDHDQAVRLLAFSAMEELYKYAPVWEIADQLVNDPDPQIRMRALELLTYGDHLIAIDRLVLALSDPDPEIREIAEDLLADLEEDLT